jgi:hypothetical protein
MVKSSGERIEENGLRAGDFLDPVGVPRRRGRMGEERCADKLSRYQNSSMPGTMLIGSVDG